MIKKCIKKFFKKKNKVAVIRLAGVIGQDSAMKSGLSLENIDQAIEKAFATKDIKAVALAINSPGGSPVQSELIYRKIRSLSLEKKLTVYSFVEDCAASGGYWLALAGDEIYVSSSSIVGSIGVISAGFGFVEAIKKIGIERRIYTQGKNKSILDPFSKEKSEDIAIISRVQAAIHNIFKDIVRERRQGKINNEQEDSLFNGEFWCGAEAKDLGLVDGIDNLYDFMRHKYGKDVEFVKTNKPSGWLKRKLGVSALGIDEKIIAILDERMLKSRIGL